ncbi:MAG: hypothetical protein NTX76_05885 [Alphaproteobacteria bacterium]|nr:hypothetical protein [Alphaproteobacteria bacterium]
MRSFVFFLFLCGMIQPGWAATKAQLENGLIGGLVGQLNKKKKSGSPDINALKSKIADLEQENTHLKQEVAVVSRKAALSAPKESPAENSTEDGTSDVSDHSAESGNGNEGGAEITNQEPENQEPVQAPRKPAKGVTSKKGQSKKQIQPVEQQLVDQSSGTADEPALVEQSMPDQSLQEKPKKVVHDLLSRFKDVTLKNGNKICQLKLICAPAVDPLPVAVKPDTVTEEPALVEETVESPPVPVAPVKKIQKKKAKNKK